MHHGRVMMEYGAFNRADSTAVALLAECGQHFAATSGRAALRTASRFLRYCEVADPAFMAAQAAVGAPSGADVCRISDVRAPYENRTLLMPRRRPVKGQEVATLAQRQ